MIQVRMFQDEESGKRFYGPILCCDLCKRQITDLGLALYKWRDDDEGIPVPGTFILLHKRECDEAHDQLHDAEHWHWNEATTLIAHLVNNAQGERELSVDLWPYLVERYCPIEQLKEVQQVARRIRINPDNRPPSVNDLF